MRNLGILLLIAGFLAAALVAVMEKSSVNWAWFVPFLLQGGAGVALIQLAQRRHADDATRTGADIKVLKVSLVNIVAKLGELDDGKSDIDVYDLPERIDSEFRGDIDTFVDARESIAHVYGMKAYGDVMSHFAAAERYLNRVWSCAVDGYIDEAHTYIGRSHEQFRIAQGKLEKLGARPGLESADPGR